MAESSETILAPFSPLRGEGLGMRGIASHPFKIYGSSNTQRQQGISWQSQ